MAESHDYYVDCAGGADGNDGTSAAEAWRSLRKASSVRYEPGDRVGFKRGCRWTGTLAVASSGTKAAPITYAPYGRGGRPTITQTGRNSVAVRVTGDYNTIEGLLVRDAALSGIHVRDGAERNVVRDIEAVATGTGVMLDGAHNVVTRSYVHDLKMIVVSDAKDDDWGAVCFWLAGPDNEVSYNRGVNCKAPSIDYITDGGFVEVWDRGDRSSIHHNRAVGTNGFLELGADDNGSANDVGVAYNLLTDSGGLCLQIGSRFAVAVNDLRFENNTVVGPGQFLECIRGAPPPSTLLLRNNIFFRNGRISPYRSFLHENNLYSRPPGYALGPGEQRANPEFVDPARQDYELRSGSPAIDAGIDLGYRLDLAGAEVPAGAAPDLGAFEHIP